MHFGDWLPQASALGPGSDSRLSLQVSAEDKEQEIQLQNATLSPQKYAIRILPTLTQGGIHRI